MANARRGDVTILISGVPQLLRLTLGALAELEAAFGVDDLNSLGERFAQGRLKSTDLIALLGAGLRAGGWQLRDDEVSHLEFDGGLYGAVTAITQLLTLTFGAAIPEGETTRPPA
jgi:hypothetical protein